LTSCRLTIGITAFNAENTVLDALASARLQSVDDYEVIIVDDASTDGTRAVLEDAVEAHGDRVRLVSLAQNVGVAAARNRIIAQARGAFLAFFDDDDISRPERCARQMARIESYEASHAPEGAPVICHTARQQLYPDGTVRIEHTMGEREAAIAPHGLGVAMRILRGDPLKDGYGSLATCSQMARTETYRKLGGFDPAFRRGEDTEFSIRLARAGAHFVGIADPLVRQTMAATADKPIAAERMYGLALLDKHRDLFRSDNDYFFCRAWLDVKDSWMRRSRSEFVYRLLRIGLRHPLQSLYRAGMAMPNLSANRAVSRLHGVPEHGS